MYSLGIILFKFVVGRLPYFENIAIEGYDLFKLLRRGRNEEFWAAAKGIFNLGKEFPDDFKELFNGMTHYNPFERYTLE